MANSVSKVQTFIPNVKWKHVRSADNPADLATRGLAPIDLKENTLWWTGPWWLQQDQSSWPHSLAQKPEEINLERKPIKANFAALAPNIESILKNFSSWSRVVHFLHFLTSTFIYQETNLSQRKAHYSV